jgi:hypothetical protein
LEGDATGEEETVVLEVELALIGGLVQTGFGVHFYCFFSEFFEIIGDYVPHFVF